MRSEEPTGFPTLGIYSRCVISWNGQMMIWKIPRKPVIWALQNYVIPCVSVLDAALSKRLVDAPIGRGGIEKF